MVIPEFLTDDDDSFPGVESNQVCWRVRAGTVRKTAQVGLRVGRPGNLVVRGLAA